METPRDYLLVLEHDYLLDLEVLFHPCLDPKPWWGFLLQSLHDYLHVLLHCVMCSGGVTRGEEPLGKKFGAVFCIHFGQFWHTFFGPWFSNSN
jgi:hypothetical protein